MFSNLDKFLNGKIETITTKKIFVFIIFSYSISILAKGNIYKDQLNDLPDTSLPNASDFDLDLSISSETKSKSKSKSKVKDDDEVGAGASFIPSKGQKTAAKRLKKIGGM